MKNQPLFTSCIAGWKPENVFYPQTENTALASGVPSTPQVAECYKAEADTQVSIANGTFVSSCRQDTPVHKGVEGLEPSRREVSTSALHHATPYSISYHAEKRHFSDLPAGITEQSSVATPTP